MKSEDKRLVYDITDIREQLGIGRDAAYQLCRSGSFRVLKVGSSLKIPKESFHRWLEGTEENNEEL